jgi:cytochrome P450
VGADGVFSSHGETWTKDRRMFAPPLNRKNVNDYIPFVRTTTQRLIEKWSTAIPSTPTIVINHDLLAYTMDNISLVAFGQDMDCLRNPHSQRGDDLRKVFRAVYYRALSPIRYWRLPLIGKHLDLSAFSAERIQRNIAQTVALFQTTSKGKEEAEEGQQPTYLEKMLSQTDYTQDRIMGNLFTMFAAGTDTTGNTIMICLWELLQEEQKDYYEEVVQEALALPDLETATLDDLMENLPRIRAFFYEINRLKGTAPMSFLQTAEAVQVGGVEVPSGHEIIIDYSYLGTLEGSGIPDGPQGESPAMFCPRRWLSRVEGSKWTVTKPSSTTGVPHSSGFGSGVRICPGQVLAELEAIYCLASLLRSFDLSLKPGHAPVKLMTNFTDMPDKDIELVMKPR